MLRLRGHPGFTFPRASHTKSWPLAHPALAISGTPSPSRSAVDGGLQKGPKPLSENTP